MYYSQHKAIKEERKLNYKGIFTFHSLLICAERYISTRKYDVNIRGSYINKSRTYRLPWRNPLTETLKYRYTNTSTIYIRVSLHGLVLTFRQFISVGFLNNRSLMRNSDVIIDLFQITNRD